MSPVGATAQQSRGLKHKAPSTGLEVHVGAATPVIAGSSRPDTGHPIVPSAPRLMDATPAIDGFNGPDSSQLNLVEGTIADGAGAIGGRRSQAKDRDDSAPYVWGDGFELDTGELSRLQPKTELSPTIQRCMVKLGYPHDFQILAGGEDFPKRAATVESIVDALLSAAEMVPFPTGDTGPVRSCGGPHHHVLSVAMVERLHEIYFMWAIMMKKDGIWSDIAKDATLNDWIRRLPLDRPAAVSPGEVLWEPLGLLSEEEKVSRWELLVLHEGFYNFMSSEGRAMSDAEEDAGWKPTAIAQALPLLEATTTRRSTMITRDNLV